MLARKLQLAAPLRKHRLTIPHFFHRVLKLAVGDFECGLGAIEIRSRRDATLDELAGTFERELRLVNDGLCLFHERRLGDVNGVRLAVWREAEACASLTKHGFGLRDAKLVIPRLDLCQRLALDDFASEIDWQRRDAPRDLHADDRLLLGSERAIDDDGTAEHRFTNRNDLYFARVGCGGRTHRVTATAAGDAGY